MFEKIAKGEYEPYCFHMCWTAGKADKLKFLKQEKLWYLEPDCDLNKLDDAPAARLRQCALGAAGTCAVVGAGS